MSSIIWSYFLCARSFFPEFRSSIQTDLKRSIKKAKKKQKQTASTKTKADLRKGIFRTSNWRADSVLFARRSCRLKTGTGQLTPGLTHQFRFFFFFFGLLHVKWDTPNLGFLKKLRSQLVISIYLTLTEVCKIHHLVPCRSLRQYKGTQLYRI